MHSSCVPSEEALAGVYVANIDLSEVRRPPADNRVLPDLPMEGNDLKMALQMLLKPSLITADYLFPEATALPTCMEVAAGKHVQKLPFEDMPFVDAQHCKCRAEFCCEHKEKKIRLLFLSFFVSQLHNYRDFFVVTRVNPDKEVHFDAPAFFAARKRYAVFPHFTVPSFSFVLTPPISRALVAQGAAEDDDTFLRAVVGTMAFGR
jgi:hypothetical protein